MLEFNDVDIIGRFWRRENDDGTCDNDEILDANAPGANLKKEDWCAGSGGPDVLVGAGDSDSSEKKRNIN